MNKEEIIDLCFKNSIILRNKNKDRRMIIKTFVLDLLPLYISYSSSRYIRFSHLMWNLYNPDNIIMKKNKNLIHHKDLDSLNDNIENLEKMLHSKHTILHNTGNTYCLGHKQTLEDRMKKSLAHKGKKFTKEHKENMSKARKDTHIGKNNPFYGKYHTEESKEKIRLSKIGKKFPNLSESKKKYYRDKKYKQLEELIYCQF